MANGREESAGERIDRSRRLRRPWRRVRLRVTALRDSPTAGPAPSCTGRAFVRLLEAPSTDDAAAAAVVEGIYRELRELARRSPQRAGTGNARSTPGLVQEARQRLLGGCCPSPTGRLRFYAAAATAMRRLLVDHARRCDPSAAGVGDRRLPSNVIALLRDHRGEAILSLEVAFLRMAAQDPGAAEVVQLRFYAGLSTREAAELLDMEPCEVVREWVFARAWLYREWQVD